MPKVDIFVFFKALEYPKSFEVYRTENSLFFLKLKLLEVGMVQVALSKSTMSSWNSCDAIISYFSCLPSRKIKTFLVPWVYLILFPADIQSQKVANPASRKSPAGPLSKDFEPHLNPVV